MILDIEKNFITDEYEIVDNSLEGFRNVLKRGFSSVEEAENYLKDPNSKVVDLGEIHDRR